MAQTRTFCHANSPESCWIRYKIALGNLKLEDVAKKARRTISLVSYVISGDRRSKKVESALAEMLGYPSWEQLWSAAQANAEKEAV